MKKILIESLLFAFLSGIGASTLFILAKIGYDQQQQIKELKQLVISLEADLRICQGEE